MVLPVQLAAVTPQRRVMRYPEHTFFTRNRPWAITPCLLAPVLPGETLKNVLYQARSVTKPLAQGIIGWWFETFLFYVKHRDLDDRDALTQMVLDQTRDNSALASAANVPTYHAAGGIDWTSKCLKRVVEEYFRDDGEAWNVAMIGNYPAAKVGRDIWLDSLINNAAMPEVADLPESATDEEKSYQTWLFMRQQKMVEMDYEEWLRTYGVRTSRVELHKPELIRFIREWAYPSNTVDPVTGAPVGAASWSVQERADKDRFFTEPGFIFGVTVHRPKVYFSKLKGSAAGFLNDAFSWLPAVMRDAPETSLKEFANNAGPLAGNITDGYWIDMRDLFLYGDQFHNLPNTTVASNRVDLPALTGVWKYATATDADAMFLSAVAPANEILTDGVFRFTIAGREQDHT